MTSAAARRIALMMFTHGLGDIGELLGDHALPRTGGLPEFVVDNAQVGNVLDDPLRFRVEPRDALSGRRVFEIAQPVLDQAADI